MAESEERAKVQKRLGEICFDFHKQGVGRATITAGVAQVLAVRLVVGVEVTNDIQLTEKQTNEAIAAAGRRLIEAYDLIKADVLNLARGRK